MYRPWNEKQKVSVIKNSVFAFRLIWKIDKALPIGYLISIIIDKVFYLFVQNVLFLKVLLNVIDGSRDFRAYIKYLVIIFAISALMHIADWWGYYKKSVATKKILQGLNNLVFEKASQLDLSCYEDPEFYDKYQRATEVLSSGYFDIICWNFATIIGNFIAFFCVITTVAVINPVYLCFLAPILLVFVVQTLKNKQFYKRNVEMTRNNRVKAYIQRTMFLRDYSKDMRTSNIFAVLMRKFENAIKSNIEIYKKYGLKVFIYSFLGSLFGELLPLIATYSYAGYEFINHKGLSISGFSVVLSSITSIDEATYQIAECFDELSYIAMYFQYLRDFFDYQPKITDGSLEAGEFESLEFRNVSFTYPGADKPSLKNISFKIDSRKTVAVVGVNGAGKSTLVKLILRFYDTDEGEILYNGHNIKEYTISSYRNAFATVFQDYRNFALTVFENVICRECDEDDKALARKSLIKSGVWGKISTLANGGDTVLTREFDENGAGLSGGEGQKVSTARLFARDFEIAILDEPSSALDPIAEYKMYESLIKATDNKAVIFISHRLSSAVLSDEILVMNNGELIERGTHRELMEANGEYSRMFTLQASSYNREEVNNED